MQHLYDRFGLKADLDTSRTIFMNKMNNIFWYGQLGADIFEGENNVLWGLCYELGLNYDDHSEARNLFRKNLNLSNYFFRCQALLDYLWNIDEESKRYAKRLGKLLAENLEKSPLDLGYRVKIFKTKAPQVFPSTSKRTDKIISDSLDLLDDKKYASVAEHFEEALKEFMKAKTKAQLKDVVEDLLTACDNLVKVIFSSNNMGFNHLFKEKRWEKIGINSYQKNIMSQMNDWMDKIKHDVIKDYTKGDVEYLIATVASTIQLIIEKQK